ncbi:MAG: hypothetical protein H6R13_3204 [Proteobacteria bacterium]|nr:hypothetical protein [Pseudomonadota bacterium]
MKANYAATATEMTSEQEDLYQCVGVCMSDPDSGYCLGCGRPPLGEPGIVAELTHAATSLPTSKGDPDTPE